MRRDDAKLPRAYVRGADVPVIKAGPGLLPPGWAEAHADHELRSTLGEALARIAVQRRTLRRAN